MGLLEHVRSVLRYDAEGALVRLTKVGRSSVPGKRLGSRASGRDARIYVTLSEFSGRKKYLLHRLRAVSHAENMQNMRRARKDSTSGLIGAMPHQGRWRSDIKASGKKRYLGVFDTAEAAHLAYVGAKRVLHPFGTL